MKDKITLTKDNLKILICCHKACELPPNPDGIFLPIQVGAAISNMDLGMQRDDQVNGEPCDNISAKNKSYCELTALYWAWKNIKKLYPNLEYIGLNHYRRYFAFDKKYFSANKIFMNSEFLSKYAIDIKKIQQSLTKTENSIVLLKKEVFPFNLFTNYALQHISVDLRKVEKIISDAFSDYSNAFHKTFYLNNKVSPCNMFIMHWAYFEKYCEWLFALLEKSEKLIDISSYDDVQKRIFGYLAERLLNVYAIKMNSKITYFPAYVIDNQNYSYLHYQMNKIRFDISFLLGHPGR